MTISACRTNPPVWRNLLPGVDAIHGPPSLNAPQVATVAIASFHWRVHVSFAKWVVLAVLLLGSSFRAMADEDAQQLAGYRLSMATMQKLEQAMVNLAAAVKANPELKDEDADNETIADISAYHRERPALRKAIERAGLNTDEYALATLSWLQASMAVAMAEAVPPERRAKALADAGVPAANVEFVRKNRAALDAINQRLKALAPRD